jgi:anti-anti-sigma factor
MSLKISFRETADAVILDLSGRITLGEPLAELRDSIRESVVGDRKNVLLNLADVTYIDSSGLEGSSSAAMPALPTEAAR